MCIFSCTGKYRDLGANSIGIQAVSNQLHREWDMSKPEPKKTHVVHQWRHSSPLITCRFDPQGRTLLTSAQDMSVQRWQFPSAKKVDLVGHDSWVRDMAFLADGQTAITVASDDKMIVWSLASETPVLLQSIEAHQGIERGGWLLEYEGHLVPPELSSLWDG